MIIKGEVLLFLEISQNIPFEHKLFSNCYDFKPHQLQY